MGNGQQLRRSDPTQRLAGDRAAELYLTAREVLIDRGYAAEIDWQETRCFSSLSETDFLREAAWVVLCAGMRETVVRRCFGRVSDAFLKWASAICIAERRAACEAAATRAFNHRLKIHGIADICVAVAECGFQSFKQKIEHGGTGFLQSLSFIGPVTSYHLAKNIGLDVVKPDRHLVRLAAAIGFSTPLELCQAIAVVTGDRVGVVDLVLWRYAALGLAKEHISWAAADAA